MKISILKSPFLIPFIASFVFFIAAFLTLGNYGPSWDETIHFRRGQAYLHYFLTGQKTYNLPNYNLQGTQGDPQNVPFPRRSFYQNDIQNGEYFLNYDIGHPPLNDELAAFLNYIFYQKLGIMDDLSSHHLFNILASSLLVFAVVFLAQKYWGFSPSLVAFLALVSYPLFWAESHFNIKDPPETAFFSLTILSFILSLEKKSVKWLVIATVFFALGLGTKLNILFLPFILLPYLLINREKYKGFKKRYFITFALAPLIVSIVFVSCWPYLWQDIPQRLLSIATYYKEIGTISKYQPEEFFVLGFNTYPIKWIIFTTPPLVLVLTAVGIVSAWINRNRWNRITILLLLWIFIPILRVTVPGTTIYGGVRQILEFLPALVLICTLGAWQISQWFRASIKIFLLTKILIVIMFLWPLFLIFKLHPYQNVYFNFLIGGLKGAYQRDFPAWGNSLGGAYKGGIDWINANAQMGAKLTLIQGTPSNVPPLFLRRDINYLADGSIDPKFYHFSGINRDGEYIMELNFNDSGRDFHYTWEYVENFLQPVYELKVDSVPILKIWKNDLEHTENEFKLNEKQYKGVQTTLAGREIKINLQDVSIVSRLLILFKNKDCNLNMSGFIETSLDGDSWQREQDIFPQYQAYRRLNLTDSKLEYFFAGRKLKYIRVIPSTPDQCILNYSEVKITVL